MDRLSILNLAGRAGRLLQDYYGKIYCINIGEWKNGKNIFEDRLEKLQSSAEKTLEGNTNILQKYLEDKNYFLPQNSENISSVAISLMMKELQECNSAFLNEFKERSSEISDSSLSKVRDKLDGILPTITLNTAVILKNRSIDPRYQQDLYCDLKNSGFETAPALNDEFFYNRLESIFRKIARFIFRETGEACTYYTNLAFRWMGEESYKSLIKDKIDWNKHNIRSRESWKGYVNRMISVLDEEIETKIKYDYTRALKCYINITQEILKERQEYRDNFLELPIYLEAGVHTKNVLFLLEAGISRNTAIELKGFIEKDFTGVSDSISWLKSHREQIEKILAKELFGEIANLLNNFADLP